MKTWAATEIPQWILMISDLTKIHLLGQQTANTLLTTAHLFTEEAKHTCHAFLAQDGTLISFKNTHASIHLDFHAITCHISEQQSLLVFIGAPYLLIWALLFLPSIIARR